MTRRDFVVIAYALRRSAPFDTGSAEWEQWKCCVTEVANQLQVHEARFTRSVFIKHCIPAGRDNPDTWPD